MKNILLIGFLFLMVGCKPKITPPTLRTNGVNLQSVVFLGDSYLSGYNNGALTESNQSHSIAALLSLSFEKLDGNAIQQPRLTYSGGVGVNSKPWISELVAESALKENVPDCQGELSLKPVKVEMMYDASASYVDYTGNKNTITDYSIPFVSLRENFEISTGESLDNGGNLYYHRFRQTAASSVISDVMDKSPTFSVIWTGMEDVYRFCRNGGYGVTLLSVSDFEANLDSLLSQMVGINNYGVIANIPDIDIFPYYTLIPYNGANMSKEDADSLTSIYHSGGATQVTFVEGDNAFVIADPAYTAGVRQMVEGEYISLAIPLDSMKCNYMGVIARPIPDRYSLTLEELTLIRQTIVGYNAIIKQKATEYNLALVDISAYMKTVQAGIKYNGEDYNTEFVSGGFFSLDGFHATEKANVMIANEFVKAINSHYNATFPTVTCADCKGNLFP